MSTMWEVTLGGETVLFDSELDATSAMAALARGQTAEGAADPLDKRARVRLVPCITVLRRVELPASTGAGRRRAEPRIERKPSNYVALARPATREVRP